MAKLKFYDSHYLYLEYVIPKKNSVIFVGCENEFKISLPSLLKEEPTLTVPLYDDKHLSSIAGLIKWLEKNINNNFLDIDSRYYIDTDDCSDCIEFYINKNNKLNVKLCLLSFYRCTSDYINLYDISIRDAKLFLDELIEDINNLSVRKPSSSFWGYRNTDSNKNKLNVTNKPKTSKKYGVTFEKNNQI